MNQLMMIYFKYRSAILNVVLLIVVCAAVFVQAEGIRSVSLGIAIGLALLNAGESISRCTKKVNKIACP